MQKFIANAVVVHHLVNGSEDEARESFFDGKRLSELDGIDAVQVGLAQDPRAGAPSLPQQVYARSQSLRTRERLPFSRGEGKPA